MCFFTSVLALFCGFSFFLACHGFIWWFPDRRRSEDVTLEKFPPSESLTGKRFPSRIAPERPHTHTHIKPTTMHETISALTHIHVHKPTHSCSNVQELEYNNPLCGSLAVLWLGVDLSTCFMDALQLVRPVSVKYKVFWLGPVINDGWLSTYSLQHYKFIQWITVLFCQSCS